MEQLKVKRKDILIYNLVVFLLLSYLFLYLEYAYRNHLSPFSYAYLIKSSKNFWYVLVFLSLSAFSVFKMKANSIYFLIMSIGLIAFKIIEGLFIEFNKVIVLALFFYTVISYFLAQLYHFYLSLSYLNPNYAQNDLFEPMLKSIPCEIQASDEMSVPAELTNWDEDGCFVRFTKPHEALKDTVEVKIDFKGRVFHQKGEVVAQAVDKTGVGIKFGKASKNLAAFNWEEFTELVDELGYKPERLR